jgi:hypothetical protein
MRLQPPSRGNIVAGIVAGVAVGVPAGIGIGNFNGVVLAVVLGAVIGAAGGTVIAFTAWAGEQWITPLDLSSAASPPAVLAGDRRAGIGLGLLTGVLGGGAAWVTAGVGAGAAVRGVAGAAIGAAIGFMVGGTASLASSAWPSYGTARIWLALRHRLPWPLMGFLADAHTRGVLRQAGAVYQFRHIELQHRLATRPIPPSQS